MIILVVGSRQRVGNTDLLQRVHLSGISLMVKLEFSKLKSLVRFQYPAPYEATLTDMARYAVSGYADT